MYVPPLTVKAVVQDFTSKTTSSFQLAYRYHLNAPCISAILRRELGEDDFSKREIQALELMRAQYRELRGKGLKATEIMQQLGISRPAYYSLLPRLRGDCGNESAPAPEPEVELISLEDRAAPKEKEEDESIAGQHATEFARPQAAPLPGGYEPALRPGIPPEMSAPWRDYREMRAPRPYNPNFVRLTIKGVTLSFDSRYVPENRLSVLVDCLLRL